MTKNNLTVPIPTEINSKNLLTSDNIVSFPDHKSKEGNNMTQENVSFRDLAKLEADFERKIEHNNQLLDVKLENLNQKIDSKFDLITQKIEDGFKLQKTENELYIANQFAEQEKLNQRRVKENRTFSWTVAGAVGTITSVVVSIVIFFITK